MMGVYLIDLDLLSIDKTTHEDKIIISSLSHKTLLWNYVL